MDAALVSTAIYLFLPFGIHASRSFQPDPAMIMMLLLSIFAILRYYEQPKKTILMTAAAASALAILIKPVCLFLIFGAFFSLTIYRNDIWKSIISKDSLIFIAICLTGILFYVYGIIFDQGNLRMVANFSFVPHLLWEPYFWKLWLIKIYGTTGLPAFIGALFGILLFRKGWQRGLIIGLWIGYFIFGLVFTYHIHTHDYYQLQLIPIVALSLGPIGALLLNQLNNANSSWVSRIAIYGILLLALLLNLFLYIQSRQKPPRSRTRISNYEKEMRIAKEIGNAVEHSTKTIILAHYSEAIKYHGDIAGRYWPGTGEIRTFKTWGGPEASVERRFQSVSGDSYYEYFIATNLQELETQAGLKEFLTSKFPIIVANGDYMIFDLRQSVDLEK